jgi:hypothetical protein
LNTSANTHHDHDHTAININIAIDEGTNVAMELDHTTTTTSSSSSNSETALDYHVLPLRFLHAGETYVVNDVLGKRKGQKPDIYHKKLSLHTGDMHYVGVDGSGAEAKTSTTNLNSNNNNSSNNATQPPEAKANEEVARAAVLRILAAEIAIATTTSGIGPKTPVTIGWAWRPPKSSFPKPVCPSSRATNTSVPSRISAERATAPATTRASTRAST